MPETPRIIAFDADTGELIGGLPSIAITGEVGARIASHCLPGMTPDDVSQAYDDWFDPTKDERDELAVGRIVLTEYGYHGVVVKRTSQDGVLTSVQVRMDTPTGQTSEWFSPARLIASQAAD